MKKILICLLFVALSATSSCYANNAAKSAHHRHAETPWTLRRDVDFFRIKSQQHQDGALAYIFQNIGVTNKFYVEFGFNADNFEGGSGANSYVLHKHFGWKGLLLDGQHENPAINLHKEFILPENIASIFRKHNVPKEPDYVSIDIDSYDIWLFKALVTGGFRPRVLTVEYNANFPLGVSIACEPGSRTHEFDTAFGASLSAMDEAAREHGYSVVQVVCGLDVVLVRDDVLKGEPAPPLSHFEHCTYMRVHTPATEQRKSELMNYAVWKQTGGDIAEGKKAAMQWLRENPGRI